jgi:hypothetical protein
MNEGPSQPSEGDKRYDGRIAICQTTRCPYFRVYPYSNPLRTGERVTRCAHCGCWLNLKARIASAHCPIGRW